MCGSNFYETDVTCPSGSYDNCLTLSSQLICFLGYLIVSILTKLYFPYPVLLAVLLLCYVSMFFNIYILDHMLLKQIESKTPPHTQNTPSPRITRFPLTRISTYADFSLCMHQWGNSMLVETLVQSHQHHFHITWKPKCA